MKLTTAILSLLLISSAAFAGSRLNDLGEALISRLASANGLGGNAKIAALWTMAGTKKEKIELEDLRGIFVGGMYGAEFGIVGGGSEPEPFFIVTGRGLTGKLQMSGGSVEPLYDSPNDIPASYELKFGFNMRLAMDAYRDESGPVEITDGGSLIKFQYRATHVDGPQDNYVYRQFYELRRLDNVYLVRSVGRDNAKFPMAPIAILFGKIASGFSPVYKMRYVDEIRR
jgi:hypothetical protein